MGKIICDVCGTSYPDTATQCPICGSARPSDAQTVNTDAEAEGSAASGYHYVKGGRFSNSNVRKRNKANQSGEKEPRRSKKEKQSGEEPKGKTSKGLIITVVILLLAVLAVVGYIVVRYFLPADFFSGGSLSTTAATTPCMQIQTAEPAVELTGVGTTHQLRVTCEPADTTDRVIYRSENPTVASVSDGGLVTAVGEGHTVVTVTCGNVSVQCSVTVVMPTEPPTTELPTTEEPTTEPPTTEPPTTEEPTTEAPTQPPEECVIKTQFGENRYNDVTIAVGDSLTFNLFGKESGEKKDAVWSLKRGSCCNLTGNKLQAVSRGEVVVATTYQAVEYTFTVRVN